MKIEEMAVYLLDKLKKKGETLATAESCTGGGIGHALTAVPGSSAAYCGGVISYTNAVKAGVLGVPLDILETYGAVSSQTACHMAIGVRKVIGSDYGVSVTGIAGPEGDGSGKPVGLVYIGVSSAYKTEAHQYVFSGDRASVRLQAVNAALEQVLKAME